MRIIGLRNCDTCRKALRALAGTYPDATLQDVRETPLSEADLSNFYNAFGDALVNTRSTTWRGLSNAERERKPVDLLVDYPALMKRPVIENGGKLYLGWTADVQASLLNS